MPAQTPTPEARQIRLRGLVQGVGFRPFVWRLARELGLTGQVANDAQGVLIAAWGPPAALDALQTRLRAEAPPLSRITALESTPLAAAPPPSFTIAASGQGAAPLTQISPDAATCPACLAEVQTPAERRHAYPFANCTHCGPRLTIARAIPWDRTQTSMADFPLCPACAAEYANPADRRFHAQPIACPTCGPHLWLEGAGEGTNHPDPIPTAAALLRAGHILAIKGLGGFHLACDALNQAALHTLRQRKARDAKPFALMATLAQAEALCTISPAARALLTSPAAPIVLLPIRPGSAIPPGLAPDQDHLGIMLPATPLHHHLLAAVAGPLVMTSGNLSDEPPATTNTQARTHLAPIADALLLHNRPIENRLDDSLLALDEADTPIPLRRARGYAPAPIALPFENLPETLAMGGELKATFALIRGGEAILSPHIGDLEHAAALDDYRAILALYRRLFAFTPKIIAIDAHPGYLSSQLGEALATETGARLIRVPHHHAHMAACLADNAIPPGEIHLALLLDGLGLGPDGALWGGELLRGDYTTATRLAHLPAVPLIGGAAAMKEPWRNLLAHLRHALGPDWRAQSAPLLAHLPDPARLSLAESMIDTATLCPPCSSAGRLFDAVAAALGLAPPRLSHEGQAAMALETLARPFALREAPWPIPPANSLAALWRALLSDLAKGIAPGRIAARFHLTLAQWLADTAAAQATPGQRVALSGGVMQNRILLSALRAALRAHGLIPLAHTQVPANDGGLSLGQGVIAALQGRGA